MKQPLGVILAGGLATRMGGVHKGLLPLGAGCIFDEVLHRLTPQVAQVALNVNGDASPWAPYSLPIVADSVAEFPGPLAGVLAGLDWAAQMGADQIVTVAADTPFYPEDLVPQLIFSAEQAQTDIALAATKSEGRIYRHPTFGIWPVRLRDDLRRALNDGLRKVVVWTDAHAAGQALFPTGDIDPFFNINTPEDLAKAEAMI